MISFMVPTNPDWRGLVLSTQNLSYNSEFVHLPSWYRPQDELVCLRGGDVGVYIHARLKWMFESEFQNVCLFFCFVFFLQST